MSQPTTWDELAQHPVPEWFQDAKFGVYFHWGPYSVPAFENEWYPRMMYREDWSEADFNGGEVANRIGEHHREEYGDPSEFGYKDFIPEFTADEWDPEEWAALCKAAGAEYVGITAIHHDGFAMWDSDLTAWNAAEMGPERDVVGELAAAVRERGMKFVLTFHHAFTWWYYPRIEGADTMDSDYAGLYGAPHEEGEDPPESYYERWRDLTNEAVDTYRPDLIWFDFGWGRDAFLEHDEYRRDVLTNYYEVAEANDRAVDVLHKKNLPPGVGIVDHERSRREDAALTPWITDTAVDRKAWSHVDDPDYKDAATLVEGFVDRVSKNGNTLLNVGPRADGTIPQEPSELLRSVGDWLATNRPAVRGSRPGWTFGEGPTEVTSTEFEEASAIEFTSADKRFLRNDECVYIALMDWPTDGSATVETSLGAMLSDHAEDQRTIERVGLLGGDDDLNWSSTDGTVAVDLPAEPPAGVEFVAVLQVELA